MAPTDTQRKRVFKRGELSALAKNVGVSVSHLSRHLRGITPSQRLEQKIVAALGVGSEGIELVPNPRRHDSA